MPTVIVPDIPDDVYERLRQSADDERRSMGAELLALAAQALRHNEDFPTRRRPEYVPGEEMPAPYDLPRSSRPIRVAARAGQPRFPDPVASIRE